MDLIVNFISCKNKTLIEITGGSKTVPSSMCQTENLHSTQSIGKRENIIIISFNFSKMRQIKIFLYIAIVMSAKLTPLAKTTAVNVKT
jgi:hypothetical protein